MKFRNLFIGQKYTLPIFELLLFFRGLLFIGYQYQCPCCGWRFRTFIKSGFSLKKRERGYCPRCNAKARHRRDYLFLDERTDGFGEEIRMLHVAPKYCLSRVLNKMQTVQYLGIGLEKSFNVGALMDLSATSISSGAMDAAVCIHTLEHIQNDRQAIGELYRVLKPGGWALITVPIRLDQQTYEDATIVSEDDRKREFGEKDHVRFYGNDFMDRLKEAGFNVELHLGTDISPVDMEKYGLLDDENIFLAEKPI